MNHQPTKADRLPIREEFYSLQGEGYNVGMSAYFIRIAGCNVGCEFCDEKQSWTINNAKQKNIEDIVFKIKQNKAINVVVTGGEPTLYNLKPLTDCLKANNLVSFLETSGANDLTGDWDWICLSPKKKMLPKQIFYDKADELKVVIENEEDFVFAESFVDKMKTKNLYLQPQWGKKEIITPIIIDYIKKNPMWKLSIQIHKYIEIA
ncbi:MAG: 7-carboxy-7-deazaguanine synthase QueE [Bacteroidales bacterium]|jgi:organic radical activating enzyme|nr:7-carboxy-7-deazaguanine synthase QueE [Bacteroidales bacterium]